MYGIQFIWHLIDFVWVDRFLSVCVCLCLSRVCIMKNYSYSLFFCVQFIRRNYWMDVVVFSSWLSLEAVIRHHCPKGRQNIVINAIWFWMLWFIEKKGKKKRKLRAQSHCGGYQFYRFYHNDWEKWGHVHSSRAIV